MFQHIFRKTIFCILFFLVINHLYAQERLINLKGILVTNTGIPIIGCSVNVKGNQISSVTQTCGEFQVSIPKDYSGILAFSCGYFQDWEIKLSRLKNKSNIVIALKELKLNTTACKENYKKVKKIKIHW